MNRLAEIVRRLAGFFGKRRIESDMAEEMRQHLELRTLANLAAGMSREDARYAAQRQFGGMDQLKEIAREQRSVRWLEEIFRDVRLALRQLRKTPGFTVVALLTLALGIGVNTSMFSVLRTIFLRTLPYADADRLVRVHRVNGNSQSSPYAAANFLDLREQNSVVEHMAAFETAGFSLTTADQPPEWLQGMRTTADFFPLLGRTAAKGRVFTAEDDREGQGNVLVLSHPYWMGRFGGDPDIVGKQLVLNGQPVTIIGVMPVGFEEPLLWGTVDAWRPLALTAATRTDRGNHSLRVVARLKPGVSLAQADVELNTIAARLAADYPATNAKSSARLVPLSRGSQVDGDGEITLFVTGLALFVLLIACANLANLQFARTAARAREHAVRAALGASRGQIMRQVLTESVLLALGGGVIGVLVAFWCNHALGSRVVFGSAVGIEVPLDWRGLAFAFLISTATGILFGLLPAWLASRTRANAVLQQSTRGTGSPAQHRVRHALIVTEMALALVLLTSAAFFLGGLKRFIDHQRGYDVDGMLYGYVTISTPPSAETPESRSAFRRDFVTRLETRIAAIPGVDSFAFTRALPTWGSGRSHFRVEGQPPPVPGSERSAIVMSVSPGFFETFGVRVQQGRAFTAADRADAPPVVIINQTMARLLWPGQDPIGRRIGGTDPARPEWREVVGVVNDTRNPDVAASGAFLQTYRPWSQFPLGGGAVVLRTRLAPESFAGELRRAVADLAPGLPVRDIGTVRHDIQRGVANLELGGWMLTAFATLGLLLAAIGIYGVMAYHVVQRTNEIGIRVALGAQVRDVLALVFGQGLRLTLVGVVFGLAGAVAVGRLIGAIMPGLPPASVSTALGATALLAAAAGLACWLPARRAAKVDPVIALRAD
ncbi:MAG TPA: ABC transporter permease [Opitutaceae bacterium]|nr:ABC transporter permease [Opitutaceae bacterium]